MEIIIGKTAGFCFGVKNAVNKTIEELDKTKRLYCLGELVHNKQVTEELSSKGVNFIDNIEEAKGIAIIRAHGVPKEVYIKAKSLGIEVRDLTCPKVLHVHKIAEEYSNKNYYIFLLGQKKHPETVGTISFCGEYSSIIEDVDNISKAIEKFKNSKLKNAFVISQTTFSVTKFNNIVQEIEKQIENVEVKNTICSATKLRQEETEEISKKVDLMIIVGSKHSSNSNKLYEIAKKNCGKALFVETKEDLKIQEIKNANKIGIMAGASTPEKSIRELVDIIKKTC